MTDWRFDDLATLEQRRQLVELSASLQRATLSHRLNAIQARPGNALLGTMAAIAAKPAVRRWAFAAAVMAFRSWRRRR
jgi:hypothetical protein